MVQRFFAVFLAGLAVPGIASAQLEQRLRVWSCPVADSLLGPLGNDTSGFVYRRNAGTPDTTFYRTGPAYRDPGRPRFVFFIGVDVAIPGLLPDAQGYVILRGSAADNFTKAAAEPRVWLQLDDAPARELPLVLRGTFVGARDTPVSLPVTVGFLSADLLAIAQASRTSIRVEDIDVTVSAEDRADVRALVRTNVCPAPKNAERDYVEVFRTRPSVVDTTGVRLTPGTFYEWQVEEPLTYIRESADVRYPDILRSANIEGEVIVQFEVDTTGRADMKTFRALRSSHSGFENAVRDFVLRARFNPARLNGRRVRQLVQQPFNFTLTPW